MAYGCVEEAVSFTEMAKTTDEQVYKKGREEN